LPPPAGPSSNSLPDRENGLLASSAEVDQQRLKMISNTVPLGRLGTLDEVAKAVLFLASDDSSYITGTELSSQGMLAQRRLTLLLIVVRH
jgi:NAD(P)-dependent dehydrogenase (short-subunit alcohol dehydrogenase family)